MSLYPPEVDVFKVPHVRMKKLVDSYVKESAYIDFQNAECRKTYLDNLLNTFYEFKWHEHIETVWIVQKLIQRIPETNEDDYLRVSNIHKHNFICNAIKIIGNGRVSKEWSREEIYNYFNHLKEALDEFTCEFIPHMREEEEIFQPLLMKYFNHDELMQLKNDVIETHDQQPRKINDQNTKLKKIEDKFSGINLFDELPNELTLSILKWLDQRTLLKIARVDHFFREMAFDPSLWSVLDLSVDSDMLHVIENDVMRYIIYKVNRKSKNVDTGTFITPAIGNGITKLIYTDSTTLSSSMIKEMLNFCPNLKHLNLSHTSAGNQTFEDLDLRQLEHLDLEGCSNIFDKGIENLTKSLMPDSSKLVLNGDFFSCDDCVRSLTCNEVQIEPYKKLYKEYIADNYRVYLADSSKLKYISLNGLSRLTDRSILRMAISGAWKNVIHLDLSGIATLTTISLWLIMDLVPLLDPAELYYCDMIVNGPFKNIANGCNNSFCLERYSCSNYNSPGRVFSCNICDSSED